MEHNSNEGRLAVYTVLMGQVAELNPVPIYPNVDFICFTDQDLGESSGWSVRVVVPRIPDDSPRSSRYAKVNPHLHLQGYSRSIYVDTSVKILKDPELLWKRLLPNPEIVFGGFYHSYHFTMLEEIKEISYLGLEENSVLSRYLELAESEFPGYLNARPIWGGLLARRHSSNALALSMESWYSSILNFSRRDQLSLPLALRNLRGDQIHLSHMDITSSDFHLWPTGGYQKPASYFLADRPSVDWLSKEPPERDALLIERDALLIERDALLIERGAPLRSISSKITGGLRSLWSSFRPN